MAAHSNPRAVLGFGADDTATLAMMKRLVLIPLLAAALAVPGAAAAAPLSPAQATYRGLADRGVKNAQRLWFNRHLRWWNDRLNSHAKFPLATIWSVVPLFETLDALAIADRSRSHAAVARRRPLARPRREEVRRERGEVLQPRHARLWPLQGRPQQGDRLVRRQ